MEERSPEVAVEGESSVSVAQDTPTGQSRLAYRLAALFLLTNVVVSVPTYAAGGALTQMGEFAITLVLPFALAVGLLEFRPRFRVATIVLAVLGLILVPLPILGFVPLSPNLGLIALVLLAALSGPIALLLVLTGQRKRWLVITAVAVYVVGLLLTIWNLLSGTQAGLFANVSVLLPFVAVTLMSGATLVRYLVRESQLKRWTVMLLTLIALAAWIGGYYASGTSLLSAAFGVFLGVAVAAYLNLPDGKRRDDMMITVIALMALLVLLTICQWFFQNIGFGGW